MVRNHWLDRRPRTDPARSASSIISTASARPPARARLPRPGPAFRVRREGEDFGEACQEPAAQSAVRILLRRQRLFQQLYALLLNPGRRRSPREAISSFSQPPGVFQGPGKLERLPVRLPAGLSLAGPELRLAQGQQQVAPQWVPRQAL